MGNKLWHIVADDCFCCQEHFILIGYADSVMNWSGETEGLPHECLSWVYF